jgi:hypothetical protein
MVLERGTPNTTRHARYAARERRKPEFVNDPEEERQHMKRKRKRNLTLPGFLVATKKNGKRVKANTSVKMSLRDLRRLVSGARKGKSVRVKARVR